MLVVGIDGIASVAVHTFLSPRGLLQGIIRRNLLIMSYHPGFISPALVLAFTCGRDPNIWVCSSWLNVDQPALIMSIVLLVCPGLRPKKTGKRIRARAVTRVRMAVLSHY